MKKSLFHDWYIFGRYNGKNFTEGFILNRKKEEEKDRANPKEQCAPWRMTGFCQKMGILHRNEEFFCFSAIGNPPQIVKTYFTIFKGRGT